MEGAYTYHTNMEVCYTCAGEIWGRVKELLHSPTSYTSSCKLEVSTETSRVGVCVNISDAKVGE